MTNPFYGLNKNKATQSGGALKSSGNPYADFYASLGGANATQSDAANNNDTVNNGFFGHLIDSAQAGAAGAVGGLASFGQEFLPIGNEWLGEVADDMNKIVQRNTPLQPLEGTDWVAGAVGNAIGSGLPSLIGGAVLVGAASAAGFAVPAAIATSVYKAKAVIPALGKLTKLTKAMWSSPFGKLAIAETAGSGVEGITEAGNLITEMRNEGYSDSEIRSAALESAKLNTSWLLVANAIGGGLTAKYGKEAVKGGLKQMAKNASKAALYEGASEGVQEFGQSLIGNEAKGEEYDYEQAREAAAQAFVGSGILGGIGGAAAPYINEAATNKPKAKTEKATEEENKTESAEDKPTEPSGESVAPELQEARNVIIDKRETLDEDDSEYGRLTEVLENGNDEEVLDEANAIRGVKPKEESVATPAVKQAVEVKQEEPKAVQPPEVPVVKEAVPQEEVKPEKVEQEKIVESQAKLVEEAPKQEAPKEEKAKPPVVNQTEGTASNKVKDLRKKLPKASLVEFEKAEKDKGKDFDFNAVYDKIVSPIYAAHNNKEISDEEKKELLKWVSDTVKGWQVKEPSTLESLNEKVAESIKTFKNKRKTDVRNGAQTKSEAINHFRNYLNKYYVKTKKITPEQLEKLTKEYEDEFDDFNFGEKLTGEEMASVRQNAKNHQIEVLTNIKAGRGNSREELPKMREFLNKLHLSDSDKSALMVEFTNDLKGVIDGLRLQQKKRKGNKNAPIAAVKSVEAQIADIDNKLRKGEAVKPEYIWNVQNNIGKNEDLGIFTKEQADKYLEDLDKVVRDAKQAEINATGGKPEKQETVAQKTEDGNKKETIKKGNKFAVQPKQQEETNEGDTDKKSLLDKLNQKTKEELEKLKGKTNVDLDEAREELVKPYNIAVAKKQLTPDDVKAIKDRIDQRIEEMKAAQQAPSEQFENATAEQSKPEVKPNKFAVQPKSKEQEETGKKEEADKEKGEKEDKPTTKPNKFAVTKGDKQEQDQKPNPSAEKTPAKEPAKEPTSTTPKETEIPPQVDNDTPEVKEAKAKIFKGISDLFKKMGVVLVTDPEKLAEAVRATGFKDVQVTKDGLVWAVNAKGKGGYINGLASNDGKTIYLPENRLSPDTAVHEFTHLWSAIVRKYNPELWKRGVALMKKHEGERWRKIKDTYTYLKTDDEIADEIISRYAEDIFRKEFNNSLEQGDKKLTLKQWIKKYWQAAKRILGLNNKSLQELDAKEFASLPIQALFDGKTLQEIIDEHKKHAGKLTYDSAFLKKMEHFRNTAIGKKMSRPFNDKELEVLKEVFSAVGNMKDIDLFVNTSGRDNKYAVMINNAIVHKISRAQVNAIQYFTKAMKGYGELFDADIIEVDEIKLREKILNTNLVTEFLASKSIIDLAKLGGNENAEKFLRSKLQGQVLHKIIQKAYSQDIGTRENDAWDAITYVLDELNLKQPQLNAIEGYYKYLRNLYKKLDAYLAGGEEVEYKASFEVASEIDHSVESRLRSAVTTVKPTGIKEDIDKAGGKQSWLAKQWRKFYRAWVDKNVDIKDFDEILSNALGRALTAGESIYNKVQMAMSKASGVAHGLIEGDEKHLKAINGEMKRKPMKYIKATLANVLDIVNAEKMNKLAPDYLAKFGKDYTWVEAFGTYLGWRRLAEMARLKREAYNQELAEWTARKAAYNAWIDSGKIGDNPQVAAYKEWEAYQKAKKNAKRRWERNGKIGPDPSEAIKAEWLATHKDEEAPKRYVGKEPKFEEYKMPEGLTEKDVLKAISEAPAPFAEAANLYYKLNDNILSIMEDAGLISSELHELLNTKYKEYCPMIRDFSDTAAVDTFVESITAGGKGVANVSSMIKKIRAEGSERTIINPLESTLQTIAAVTNRAERNKAGQHLVRMMVSAPELKGQIRKLEQPKHGTIQADPKNCIFTVMFNGKKVAYQSDPEYYQAIVGYNMLTSSLLLRIPQTVASTLRTGATMSPSFIVRNIFRDTITAGIASKNGFIPIIDTIRGAKALWNDPDFRAKFEAAGIVNFNQYGSSESAYRNLTALGSGKNYTVYEPKEIIKGVLEAVFKGKGMEALKTAGISFEQLSSFAESATRAGEFKKALDAGKSMSEAAYDAKEVTLDFSRSGIIGQELNRIIPFFNACIQGGDKMARLFYENPMGTAMKVGMYIALPSLALWLLNHDEDWYEELDPSVKYTHWCLPNGVRVPKPQEYGILFGGSIEAMLDQASQKDPRAMKEWADAMWDVVTPSVLPTIILPLIEWQTNYSFFKGRDLVPQRLQRLPDELQYSTGTSEASKFIGKYTYWSPMKIDNLIRGYTGTMGMFLWQTPDWFAAEKQGLPAKELSEMQFIRDFNVTDVVRNRFVNDFYELQEKANQQQAGYGVKGKPSAAVKAIRKAGKIINDLNKDIRTIEMSDKYTPERKRELIDKKRERINATAKIVVKKYGNDFL